MSISPYAGKPAEPGMLTNIPRLVTAYYVNRPDPAVPAQRVAFGTSGHRGSSLDHAFNEAHILAITQAICLYRQQQSIDGPLFLGIDTHALSEPAFASALEVLAANGVRSWSMRTGATRRHPWFPMPFLLTTAGAARAWPTASSSRPRITPRNMAASNTIRLTEARRRPT